MWRALLSILLLWLPLASTVRAAERQPNIIFILADDLGGGDVGWRGGEIKTPHLDRLALTGVALDAFYVQPVCSPTRAALLTGRYPIRYGLQVGVVRPWARYGLPLQEQTLAEGLASAGYVTAVIGKWHLGHFHPNFLPTRRGFIHQYGHYNGAIDYNTHERDGGFDWHRDDRVCRDPGYSTHLIAKEAVSIVERYATKRPFFLYVPFNAVHSPHQVPERYLTDYPLLGGDRRLYAGMLAAMDEAIGEIMAAVDRTGIRNETLVVFSSDNGGPAPGVVTSNGELRAGKGTHYEGGVRVAAFANWPGVIPAGSKIDEPLHMVDWYPTLLRVAGATVDQKLPLDGRDIWPTLVEGKPTPHGHLLINATPVSGAIRAGDWKLVVNGALANAGFDGQRNEVVSGDPRLELFDLSQDISETTNLASRYPERANELLAVFRQYQGEATPPTAEPKGKGYKSPAIWGDFND